MTSSRRLVTAHSPSHTVLIDGAHGDFRRMPYVGGYLDRGQTIKTLGTKNRKRLSGTDKTWSEREIYPLPSSDSRSADYAELGQNNTWIKLAEPTAEAIRQAFLGHQSRICIEPPQIPSLVIAELAFEGSSILQDTILPFSPELNSIIGGRGSGKSSLLEYLSFALGRSCHDAPRDHYSGTERLPEFSLTRSHWLCRNMRRQPDLPPIASEAFSQEPAHAARSNRGWFLAGAVWLAESSWKPASGSRP